MDYNNDELLKENYNKFLEKGMNEDDAYTEAYSIDCNLDNE
jgi:hypothetical protein|nr:MAG TPA: hypothetical protein [Bacteriophage sp.]